MSKLKPDSTEIKSAIINAALDIADSEGWHAVTVRKVAEEIGYTAPIIYQYFTSKKAMLRAVAHDGYEQLNAAVQTAAENAGSDAEMRFNAIGLAYYAFAKQNFQVYQLMHDPLLYREREEPLLSANTLFSSMVAEVRTLSGNKLSVEDATTRTCQAWATIHGLIMIEKNCSLKHGMLHPEKVMTQFATDFLQSIHNHVKDTHVS